jgi:hypothetical protein
MVVPLQEYYAVRFSLSEVYFIQYRRRLGGWLYLSLGGWLLLEIDL